MGLVALPQRQLLPGERLAGPMPWVIAIMIFLTVLAAAAGLGLAGAARALDTALAGQVTVQIVEPDPAVRERVARKVLAALEGSGSIERVARVEDAATRRLLAPWLGEDGLDADLPVPALIDVTLRGQQRDTVETIVKRISATARVDRHEDWLGPLAGLLSTLQALALVLVMLTGVATAATVALAARAALDTHRSTIDVMHLMGATDGQVAALFQRKTGIDATWGAVVGLVAGLAALLLVARRLQSLGAGALSGGGLGIGDWLIIVALPAGGVAIAVLTARATVLRALATMP